VFRSFWDRDDCYRILTAFLMKYKFKENSFGAELDKDKAQAEELPSEVSGPLSIRSRASSDGIFSSSSDSNPRLISNAENSGLASSKGGSMSIRPSIRRQSAISIDERVKESVEEEMLDTGMYALFFILTSYLVVLIARRFAVIVQRLQGNYMSIA
jgi:hypothetical protein